MSNYKKVVVTGCNKGIGFGIVENICQKPYQIIMVILIHINCINKSFMKFYYYSKRLVEI